MNGFAGGDLVSECLSFFFFRLFLRYLDVGVSVFLFFLTYLDP